MIVPIFNYHLSIITIMGKNNKSLYINILSNFRYILKLIQNRLTYIIHSGFISGYQNRYGDNLKPPTNVYHRMTA